MEKKPIEDGTTAEAAPVEEQAALTAEETVTSAEVEGTTSDTQPKDAVSDSALNPDDEINADLEASTIFAKSKREEAPKKSAGSTKKRVRLLIILLAAILCIGGVLAAIFFLLPKEDTDTTSSTRTIELKKVAVENIQSIAIENNHGKLNLSAKLLDTSSATSSDALAETVEWSLDGYDAKLMSASNIGAIADSTANVQAVRRMEDESMEFGFAKPLAVVKATMRDGSAGYTITVGNMSPDSSGYYITISDVEGVYLASVGAVGKFDTTPEALANTVLISAPQLDSSTKASDKKYFDEEEGKLKTVDSIELSGSQYGEQISLLPISGNEMVDYKVKTKTVDRYANSDKVEEMMGIATNGIVAIETYKLMPTAADIKAYGLEQPGAIVRIQYGSGIISMKATMYDKDKNYYAVMVDGLNAIYAVTSDALSMLSLKRTDFYNELVFMNAIDEFTNLTIKTPSKSYSFDYSYDEDKAEITANMGGVPLDGDLFSAYYQYFVTLSPDEQPAYTNATPTVTATFRYKDTAKGKVVLELIKQSDRRYLVRIDGQNFGVVTSTNVDHIIEYAQYVVDKKGIPDPV